MGLSSNSLVHLTNEKSSLTGILKDNFKLKYCKESVLTKSGTFSAAVPMISFCDIPLSEIKNHIEKYGHYGIGLKKEWGKRNGLNPVLYIDSMSTLGESLKASTDQIKYSQITDETQFALVNILRYVKNYEGELSRMGNKEINYRFSDEREWRYVPNKNECKRPLIPMAGYDTDEKKLMMNLSIKDLRLIFAPDDINYIIIKEESEIGEFIQVLKDAKAKKYTYEQVERLMTRIITTQQIMTDF